MAGVTLEQAQAQLQAWLAASLAVAQAQSYEIAGRQLTRANADEIIKQVKHWGAEVERLSRPAAARGGIVFRRGSPA